MRWRACRRPECPHQRVGAGLAPLSQEDLRRDLHESLGARLRAAFTRVLPSGVAHEAVLQSVLGACVLELRWLQCAAAGGVLPLQPALAWLQADMDVACAAGGLALAWHIDPAAGALPLPAKVWLQVLRVAREALDNSVQHAREATRVGLTLELLRGETGRHLRLLVHDDGQLPSGPGGPAAGCPGQGLAMVRKSATEMGAQLSIGPRSANEDALSVPGWAVELVLPVSSRRGPLHSAR